MPLTIPPELKKITPYVRRAEELDKDKSNAESRLVAYYCRQYAVHTGIGLATSPTGKTCLGELLSALEEEKTAMDAFTRDEAKFLCRKFADKIFEKADSEDRSGAATKATAKTFYAAASFLEILQQFYKDDEESEELEDFKKRAVYSKWKATDILKAIKEGREPTPGGYQEDAETEIGEDEGVESTPKVETVTDEEGTSEPEAPIVRLPSTEQDKAEEPELATLPAPVPPTKEGGPKDEGTEVELTPPPTYDFEAPVLPPPPAQPVVPVKPPMKFTPAPAPPPMPAPPATKPTPPPEAAPAKKSVGFFGFGKNKSKSKTSKAEIADAIELTKFALAALEEKNTDLAADRLQQALGILGR